MNGDGTPTIELATGQTWRSPKDKSVRVIMCVGEIDGRRFLRWSRPGGVGIGTRCWFEQFEIWVKAHGAERVRA